MVAMERRVNSRLVLLAIAAFFLFIFWNRSDSSTGLSDDVGDKDDYSTVVPKDRRREQTIIGDHPVVDWIHHSSDYTPDDDYRVIYSRSTKDKKYLHVDFAGDETYNVNLVPHPSQAERWIVIAQHHDYRDDIMSSEQLVCIARIVNDVLHCDKWPEALPISPSIDGHCDGEWAYTNMRRGPRDARVFYGPDYPYIIYGSQSQYTCLGLWVQNLWMLLDGAKHPPETFARGVLEVQRPEPRGQLEKNYFLFWDENGTFYAHYDISPKRAFAQLRFDGSVVRRFMTNDALDLAQFSADHDELCMEKLFPSVDRDAEPDFKEGLHQGTNSLSITMCKRADPSCIPSDENTFILHIMQHKRTPQMHGIYKPYPILFQRNQPFKLHAVSSKPLFYHGVQELTAKSNSRVFNVMFPEIPLPSGYPEQIYTTSISWKSNKQTYHGYLDDMLWIGFGVEDTRSAAIDVLASDILQDLSYCTPMNN